MKQIYYAIQNIVRGKNANLVKVISITCGLLVAIILFAKIFLNADSSVMFWTKLFAINCCKNGCKNFLSILFFTQILCHICKKLRNFDWSFGFYSLNFRSFLCDLFS